MNLSDVSKKILRYPVLFGCAILFVSFSAIAMWRSPMVEEMDQEIQTVERQWKQMQTNVERSSGLDSELALLQASSEDLATRLMRSADVAANHEFFYRLERNAGVKIRSFNKGDPVDGPAMAAKLPKFKHFEALPFNLGLEGDFSAVLDFLDQLKSSRHVVHIERISLAIPVGASDPEMVTANLRCYILGSKPS